MNHYEKLDFVHRFSDQQEQEEEVERRARA
jgi:hypothetical protein